MKIPVANIQIRFIDNIYRRTVSETPQFRQYLLDQGRKILQTPYECQQYLVVYGAHHYHKLFVAFESTPFEYIGNRKVEIIDWGSGIGTATCILIDYLIGKGISLDIDRITWIEPSSIATDAGKKFLVDMFQGDETVLDTLQIINKRIDNLTIDDFVSETENVKIHLFSNILDMPVFDLAQLYTLIVSVFSGKNRLICIGPSNETKGRIDEFHALFANSFNLVKDICERTNLHREVFIIKGWSYGYKFVGRYERQFSVTLPEN